MKRPEYPWDERVVDIDSTVRWGVRLSFMTIRTPTGSYAYFYAKDATYASGLEWARKHGILLSHGTMTCKRR